MMVGQQSIFLEDTLNCGHWAEIACSKLKSFLGHKWVDAKLDRLDCVMPKFLNK